jgi:hypothetical protein
MRTHGKEKESYPARNTTDQIELEACTSRIAMHQIWINICTRTSYKRAGQCMMYPEFKYSPADRNCIMKNPSILPRVALVSARACMHGPCTSIQAETDRSCMYIWLRYQLSVPLTISYKDHTQADSDSLSVTMGLNFCYQIDPDEL